MTAEERFTELARHFKKRAAVRVPSATAKTGFGSATLRVNGKIFAMLVRGRLVVKIPAEIAAQLKESNDGQPFMARKSGPQLREWLMIKPSSKIDWIEVASIAIAHADPARKPKSRRRG